MPVPLGSKGQADFTEPIELLTDCHRRIELFLGVLQKLATLYKDRPLDEEGTKALETALNYFRFAAPRHTADEEQSLFPRMRRCHDEQTQQVMAQIDRLESDHRQAETAHARVDDIGRQWLADRRLGAAVFVEFCELVNRLAKTYGEHIPIEDQNVFVLAKRVLSDEQLQAVGEEMEQRRQPHMHSRGATDAGGVNPTSLPGRSGQ